MRTCGDDPHVLADVASVGDRAESRIPRLALLSRRVQRPDNDKERDQPLHTTNPAPCKDGNSRLLPLVSCRADDSKFIGTRPTRPRAASRCPAAWQAPASSAVKDDRGSQP